MAESNASAVRGITCPGCGAALELRVAGYTVTLVCEYCGSVLDTTNPDVRLIARFSEEQRKLTIPLGTRSVLRGTEWQAVGYMRRSSSGSGWEEYLLFNPYRGYRWLVGQDGVWSFGTMLTANPELQHEAYWRERTYRLFYGRGTARVDYVLGEFYWRVAVGETVTTLDCVRPGAMLSMEENAAERSWTLNEYLPPAEINAAFPSVAARGWYLGSQPAPHQPSPFAPLFKPWRTIALAATIALLFSYFTTRSPAPMGTYEVSAGVDRPTTTSSFGPFRFPAPWQGLTVRTRTPQIDQGWTDIDIAFVNRQTQARYEVYSLNENYYGYDQDGAWSEGSRDQTVKVAGLPGGTYDLIVEAAAHAWPSQSVRQGAGRAPPVTVSVSVSLGAVFYSNLWLALGLILSPFLVLCWLQYVFDKDRLKDMDGEPSLGDWVAGYNTP